jgi:hypothetical protein
MGKVLSEAFATYAAVDLLRVTLFQKDSMKYLAGMTVREKVA